MFYLATAKTTLYMVIDHAHGLHKGIYSCGADKAPPTLFQIFGKGFGHIVKGDGFQGLGVK
jgi:hypothetical protein